MAVERRTFSADDILQLAAEVDSIAASLDDEAGNRIRTVTSILRHVVRELGLEEITVAHYKIRLKRPT